MIQMEGGGGAIRTLSTRYRGTLCTLNKWAAAWHLLLALVIGIVVASVGSPFTLRLTKHYQLVQQQAVPAILRTVQCTDIFTNVTRNFTDVFEYLNCVSPARIPLATVAQPAGSVRIWVLLLIFELVTAISHLRLVCKDQQYHEMLMLNLQPARWREYAITNTLMLVSILTLNGISEVYLVLHIVLGAIFMNYCGGLVFEVLSAIEQLHTLRQPLIRLVKEAKLLILALSWTAFMLSLVYLFDQYNATTRSYFALETGFFWRQLFEIIFILNVGITVCYSAFPFLHLLQTFTSISYYTIEIGYVVASLVAKSFLTIIVMTATIQRS